MLVDAKAIVRLPVAICTVSIFGAVPFSAYTSYVPGSTFPIALYASAYPTVVTSLVSLAADTVPAVATAAMFALVFA